MMPTNNLYFEHLRSFIRSPNCTLFAGKATSTSFGTSAGYTLTSQQHAISNPSSKFALDMNSSVTPSSNIHGFGFSSTKSASVPPAPAPVPQTGTSCNISGTSSLAATAATLSPFTFGSSSVSQQKKSPFQFGAPSVPSSQITSPSTHLPQADESQKKMFDQEIKNTSISSNISGLCNCLFGIVTKSFFCLQRRTSLTYIFLLVFE